MRILMFSVNHPLKADGGQSESLRGTHDGTHDYIIMCSRANPMYRESGNYQVYSLQDDQGGLSYKSIQLIHIYERYLQGQHFDLIHVYDAEVFRSAKYIRDKYLPGVKIVSTVQLSMYVWRRQRRHRAEWLSKDEQRLIAQSDVVIVPSQYYADAYRVDFDRDDIIVLPNAVDRATPQEPVNLSLPPDGFNLGFVGRFAPQKRSHWFFKNRIPDGINLHIWTMPFYQPVAEQMIAHFGSPGNYYMHGSLDLSHRQAVYESLDGVFFPSDHESFGIGAMEAMEYGVPLICEQHSGLASFVRYTNAWIWEPGEDLGELVGRILHDPWRTEQKILQGYETASRYDWSNTKHGVHEIYAQIVK